MPRSGLKRLRIDDFVPKATRSAAYPLEAISTNQDETLFALEGIRATPQKQCTMHSLGAHSTNECEPCADL